MKEVLIINGHPNSESYNFALADRYAKGALQSNAKLERIDIARLDFNPSLEHGYQTKMPMEPDLVDAIEKIKKAEHLVWIFPMWWYGYPAIMKGFIDRIFLPNIAFKFEGKPFPKQLFKGKTARIILTADTPQWYNKWFMKQPTIHQLKKGTLEFCGIKPVKTSYIAPLKGSTEKFRKNWLDKVYHLGLQMK